MGRAMSDSAIGLIETHGLIGVLEAADTAVKAADVQLLGVERIGGGLVSVRFRGDTASVQAAVRAASEAVRRVSELVSAHVIPAPAFDVEAVLAADAAVDSAGDGGKPRTGSTGSASTGSASTGSASTGSGTTEGRARVTPAAGTTDLQSLPVARLRQLARKTPGLALQGRQISRANKRQLLDALAAAQAAGGAASLGPASAEDSSD